MAWTEIPGMTTNLPLAAAAGPGGELFVFAVGQDSKIYLNRRAGSTWTGWAAFPGTATTKNAVSVVGALNGGVVLVMHTGMDSKIYVSQQDGDSWTAWQLLDGGAGSTPAALATVAVGKEIDWFMLGNNKHVYTDKLTFAEAL